ncbi:hypothetical protein VTH82DRAFT_3881 [Thermothelomyces myriococcoides]
MSGVPNRRPPLIASRSSPDIFCRPTDPGPAPLVYINGWHGVGKESGAERLALLLGKDQSLLINVRSVGGESTSSGNNCYDDVRRMSRHKSRHKYHRRDEHYPLLLILEHSRYHPFDLDQDADVLGPLPSSPSSCLPSAPSVYSSAASRSGSISSDKTLTSPTSPMSAVRPSIKTCGKRRTERCGTKRQSHKATTKPQPCLPSPLLRTAADFVPASVTAVSSSQNFASSHPVTFQTTVTGSLNTIITTTTVTPAVTTPPLASLPSTAENLAALLASPTDRRRIAVFPACAPNTLAGRAAMRTFEAATARAGRPFASVVVPRCGNGGGSGDGGDGGVVIVEFVKGLEAEREAELYKESGGGSGNEGHPRDGILQIFPTIGPGMPSDDVLVTATLRGRRAAGVQGPEEGNRGVRYTWLAKLLWNGPRCARVHLPEYGTPAMVETRMTTH